MIQIQPLVATPLVALARFRHPGERIHHDPPAETAGDHSISFVEQGGFDVRVARRTRRLYPGTVFVARRGLVYRCQHVEPIPRDVCLSVRYAEPLVEAARPDLPRAWHRWYAPPSNRLAYLRLRLGRLATHGGEGIAAETLACELLAELGKTDAGKPGKPYTARQLAWYVERVEASRERLDQSYAEPHSLGSLARAVGMSAFHFARVFRQLTGTPPHRYLLRVRLRRAAERLRDGAGVTETCFATGFSNLSHFIRLFRRAFGVSPSRLVR